MKRSFKPWPTTLPDGETIYIRERRQVPRCEYGPAFGKLVFLCLCFFSFAGLCEGRPRWSRGKIIPTGPPELVSYDGKVVQVRYTLRNTTGADYYCGSAEELYFATIEELDGVLAGEMSLDVIQNNFPLFIPAHRKAYFVLELDVSVDPTDWARSESDSRHNQLVLEELEKDWKEVKAFVMFDRRNRCEIRLPRWGPP